MEKTDFLVPENEFEIILSQEEKIHCLRQIIKKNRKVLYVYERSQEPNSTYDYKMYTRGLVLYISTSNVLFKGILVNILINLCSILQNDFEQAEIKKLIFENINYASFLLSKVGEEDGDN